MVFPSETVRSEVRSLMARTFAIPLMELPAEATPDNTRGWDSLAHLILIETLEKQYGCVISHAQAVTLLSDADIAAFVAAK
jgi:acyl carrier protein